MAAQMAADNELVADEEPDPEPSEPAPAIEPEVVTYEGEESNAGDVEGDSDSQPANGAFLWIGAVAVLLGIGAAVAVGRRKNH